MLVDSYLRQFKSNESAYFQSTLIIWVIFHAKTAEHLLSLNESSDMSRSAGFFSLTILMIKCFELLDNQENNQMINQ